MTWLEYLADLKRRGYRITGRWLASGEPEIQRIH